VLVVLSSHFDTINDQHAAGLTTDGLSMIDVRSFTPNPSIGDWPLVSQQSAAADVSFQCDSEGSESVDEQRSVRGLNSSVAQLADDPMPQSCIAQLAGQAPTMRSRKSASKLGSSQPRLRMRRKMSAMAVPAGLLDKVEQLLQQSTQQRDFCIWTLHNATQVLWENV
jgi:hypothetical protein